MATSQRKSYVIGVGMTNFIKPRGQVDYPGKLLLHWEISHGIIVPVLR